MESPISTPEDLVNEWKRSGGLDLARKSILNEFMSSSEKSTLLTRLDNIITTTLTSTKFKTKTSTSSSKKEKHTYILKEIESQSNILSSTVTSVERVIVEGEKDSDERKEKGLKRKRGRVHLGRELQRLLRENRGEVVSDDEEEEEEEEEVEVPVVVEEVGEELKAEKEDVEMNKASNSPIQPLLFGGARSTGGLQFSGSLQFGNPSPKKATLFSSSSVSSKASASPTPTLFGAPLPPSPINIEANELVDSEMN